MKLNKPTEKSDKNLEIICSKCGKQMKEAIDSSSTDKNPNTIDSMCVRCSSLFCDECMTETENICHICDEDAIISITYDELNKIF